MPPGPPVCPRHPERVAYVRCQRCERPACPECQRPAPVGIHCVDCVREAAAATPGLRTAFGAPVRQGRPVVTLTMLAVTVGSFLAQLVTGGGWTTLLWFQPATGAEEPYRFLSAALAHATGGTFGVTHILFNMYVLWVVGPTIELAFGRLRFLVLYLASVAGGHVLVLLLADPTTVEWFQPVVGASGGIFGLFGALFIATLRLGRDLQAVLVLLGLNLVLSFVIPGISWQGHLGGLVTGLAIGAVYAYTRRSVGCCPTSPASCWWSAV